MKALIRDISLEAIIGKTDHFLFGESDMLEKVGTKGCQDSKSEHIALQGLR
jgi:hypothetical protein